MKTRVKLLLLLLSLLLPTTAIQASRIQLLYANSALKGTGASRRYAMYGFVLVENLASRKKVFVVYGNGTKKGNREQAAEYFRSAAGNREIWFFRTPWSKQPDNYRFSLRMQANGTTRWDNNNGIEYRLSVGPQGRYGRTALGKSPIALQQISWDQEKSAFLITVAVRNIAGKKLVWIAYSTDDWKTFKTSYARFQSTQPDGSEIWQCVIENKSKDDKPEIGFSLCCEANGKEYWDNHFLRNYSYVVGTGLRMP